MMDRLKDECERVLAKLSSLPQETLYLGLPITDDRIEEFERKIELFISDDFKYLLKKHNGFSVMGTEVIGFKIEEFGESIGNIYEFEHFKAAHKMPLEFLPFSPDGRGNHYCLNLSNMSNGICPVVFWQWDFDYASISDVEECNDNFLEWVEEVLIEWGRDNNLRMQTP